MTNRIEFDVLEPAMKIERLSVADEDVSTLIDESDSFYQALYPPESNHLDSLVELSQSHVVLLGCRVSGELAACGAIKLMRDDGIYAELKRLFVKPAYRGQRLSRLLMDELEGLALQWQVPCLRLETGTRQPEALGLYASLGYQLRGPFGSYTSDPLSVFMEKAIMSGDEVS